MAQNLKFDKEKESLEGRGVVPGGAGGAMAAPDFGRSVTLISTRGEGRLCLSSNTGTPGFTAL